MTDAPKWPGRNLSRAKAEIDAFDALTAWVYAAPPDNRSVAFELSGFAARIRGIRVATGSSWATLLADLNGVDPPEADRLTDRRTPTGPVTGPSCA